MTFKRRITLVSALAVAVAVLLASGVTYLLTSNQLHRQIDQQLRGRALPGPRRGILQFLERQRRGSPREALLHIPAEELFGGRGEARGGSLPVLVLPPSATSKKSQKTGGTAANPTTNPFGSPRPNQVRGYQQVVDSSGRVILRSGDVTLPVQASTRALAAKGGKAFFTDATDNGIHLRILTESLVKGQAIQYAQPLSGVDKLLGNLRLILALLDVAGVALAALLGRVIAGAAVAPIKRLTEATEHVTQTRDLSRRITTGSEDEIGRLAVSFNAMMDALESSMTALDASVHAQRQLVADASHELRTPLTSVRTNIELLQQASQMSLLTRQRMLADVVQQVQELTLLINDLIDLARGEQSPTQSEDVRLDLLVSEAVERAGRYSPNTVFELDLQPSVLTGVPERLDRAINNLIDNAVKYSSPDGRVQVTLKGGELTVRDHGRGVSAQDLPHIFDRFYRGAEARGLPGSGLGLAIVRQVAEQHGGAVSVHSPPAGGTVVLMSLPAVEVLTGAEFGGQIPSRMPG